MRKLSLVVMSALITCLFAISPASAQQNKVEIRQLKGGGEVWVIASHDLPMIAVSGIFRDSGIATDDAEKAGRAVMASQLLSEGAGDMDMVAFQKELENKAIQLGFGADYDVISLQMKTLSEHAEEAFRLMGVALSQPRFDEDAIARVKESMLVTLRRNQEQPPNIAWQHLREMIYEGHPYANPSDGTAEGIAAVTKDDLQQFAKRHLTRENLILAVVGDITADRAQVLADQALSGLATKFDPAQKIAEYSVQPDGKTEILRKTLPQTTAVFAFKGVAYTDPEFFQVQVMNHLLGGNTFTSRLGNEIREQRGLAYYAYTRLRSEDHAALIMGSFGTRNDQAGEALSVAMDVFRSVAAGEMSDAELQDAKDYLTGTFVTALATNDALASMLVTMQRYNFGADYLERRNSLVEAVTLEQVKAQAAKLIEPGNLSLVAVGDPDANLEQVRQK